MKGRISMRWWMGLAGVAACGTGAAQPPAAAVVNLPKAGAPLTARAGRQQLRVVLVADGITAPWDIVFIPGTSDLLVTESNGALRLIARCTVARLAERHDRVQCGRPERNVLMRPELLPVVDEVDDRPDGERDPERRSCDARPQHIKALAFDTGVSRRNGLAWDAVISCEMIGVYKPHPEAYATAAR